MNVQELIDHLDKIKSEENAANYEIFVSDWAEGYADALMLTKEEISIAGKEKRIYIM